MDTLTLFHLFSFLPVLAFGGVFWFERLQRQGAQKRTFYLALSLGALALVGLLQAGAYLARGVVPLSWPQVYVLSGFLYFAALFALEYAIHVKRIEESFLGKDFNKEVTHLGLWFGLAGVVAVLVLVLAASWQWDHRGGLLSLFLDSSVQANPVSAYGFQMRLLSGAYSLFLLIATFLAASKVFNLQAGVIRQQGYPFFAQMAVTVIMLFSVLSAPVPDTIEKAWFLPVYWFALLNLVYIVRLIEEFFFWSQYNLRSDRNKIEQRQHTQNLLIRRVIGAADEDDRSIIREVMESALEKARGRMVVQEYRMTGIAVYRVAGSILKVDDLGHVLGYCTPLADNKSLKNLDKQKLNEVILRTTFDLNELRDTPRENLKDFGKRLIKDALSTRQIVVLSDLPDQLKGLQRLVVVVPIFDGEAFLGFLTVFKDSFDRLYPAERDVLTELAENLATIYALIAGKEVQKERNRLQGEMNTARTLQTSILPKKPEVPGYQVATHMETATEVGGDVFDFIPTPFGTYFGIGDVSGHGLPAGMMAVISVAALHGALDASKSLGKALSLDQVYDTVNRVLCLLNRDRIGSDKFMTQNYFVANGGQIGHVGTHLVAALWRASSQSVEELSDLTNKTGFLGLSEFMVSGGSLGSFTMEKDDVLVLYSDGVSEAKNGNGTMFGLDGIKRVLHDQAGRTPDEFVQALLEALRHHAATGDFKKHGGHYTDDVSLVVLKRE